MQKEHNKQTGDEGEQVACDYLVDLGYKIIDRNLKLVCGEIDILAEIPKLLGKGTIVIVEVKTVRGSGFGLAQDLVRFKKQNKLRQLARAVAQRYPNRTLRIDVIGVDLSDPNSPRFEHIENAVEGQTTY